MISNRSKPYRILVSIIFGLAGFALNFLNIELIDVPTFKINILAGLFFPLLIALAWGRWYGLLSALAGGCQSMWWLWRGDGWGFLYAVPVFTLWIFWHGWWADRRGHGQNHPFHQSMFLVELPFRIVVELGFYTVFRWLVSHNPPPWNPAITWNVVPLSWVHTVAVKHTITAYLLLLAAYVIIHLPPVRSFFGLPPHKHQRSHNIIVAASVLMGIVVVGVDAVAEYLFFRHDSFLDVLVFDVSAHDMVRRLLLFAGFPVFGVVAARLNRQRERVSARNSHLNRVLLAVRNVNQLITKQKDEHLLLDEVCNLLVETKGYHNVWICLTDPAGQPVEPFYHAGFNGAFGPMTAHLEAGEMPSCAAKALASELLQVIRAPTEECPDCPFSKLYRGRSGFILRLEHDGGVFGWISASVPRTFGTDTEEQDLFIEVAGDVAFALHTIRREAEEERIRGVMEDRLKTELAEKSVLLKEVHHRVKNNLQIIVSLLNMQADKLKTNESKEVFQDALYRVGAIADAHEQLFRSPSLATLSAEGYLSRIVEKQLAIFSCKELPITAVKNLDSLELTIDTAVPLGLIVNELLTNSCKYAFDCETADQLIITVDVVAHSEPGTAILEYTDNGRGLPEGLDIRTESGLGFMLISSLTQQLGGEFQLLDVDGFGLRIEFPA